MGLPKMRFCNGRATMLLETNSKNSLKNKLSLLERMVVLKSSAWSSSVLERYFVTFFDTVNNTSKGVNIYQKSTWALSLPLTMHFMAATDLPVLKIMYRAVYLNKSPQKGQLSHHDRRYLHHCPDLLAWLSEEQKGVFLACVLRAPNLVSAPNLVQLTLYRPFLPHRKGVRLRRQSTAWK